MRFWWCVLSRWVHLVHCSHPGDALLAIALAALRPGRTSDRLTTQPRRRVPWKRSGFSLLARQES